MSIRLNNTRIGYHKPLSQPLNLDFGEGIHIIYGPSGCGKSTLLKTIAGLTAPLSGSVQSGSAILCFQEPLLLDEISVAKNLEFAMGSRKSEADEKLLMALDIDDLLDQKASKISGGQRQRLALAMALLKKPSVLLLDEALSFQDRQRKFRLIEFLKDYVKKHHISCLWVTHSQKEALLAGDDFYRFEDGKLQQVKNPGNFFRD